MSDTQDDASLGGTALTCFVIGPIGDRLAPTGSEARGTYEEGVEIWEEVIDPACAAVGLEPVRADGLSRPGEITEQVFRRLRDDDVVIADLSGANANVMYELGLRHTRSLLTVQIGEYGRLPFDVNVIRTVRFSRSRLGLISARNELIDLLQQGITGQYDPATATRVWSEADSSEEGREPSAAPFIDGEDEASDDRPGFLDVVAAGEEHLQGQLLDATQAVAADISRMGDLANNATAEMQQSDARGSGMRGRLAVAARYANSLGEIADDIDDHVNHYVDSLQIVSAGNLAIIANLEQSPDQLQEDEVKEWALVNRRMAKIARESLSGVNQMVSSMIENARLSKTLRPPTNRITHALGRLTDATSEMDEWDRRLQSLGVPVPADDWEPDITNGASEAVRPDGNEDP